MLGGGNGGYFVNLILIHGSTTTISWRVRFVLLFMEEHEKGLPTCHSYDAKLLKRPSSCLEIMFANLLRSFLSCALVRFEVGVDDVMRSCTPQVWFGILEALRKQFFFLRMLFRL